MAILTPTDPDRAKLMTQGNRSDDPKIAALQIAAIDDDAALAVYADWCLEHVRPDWQTNPCYRLSWWRNTDYGSDYAISRVCADIVSKRSGECATIVASSTTNSDLVVETWAGRVCQIEYDYNYRIMSDVWGTATYALVLTLSGEIRKVYVSNSEFGGGTVAVDAAPDVLAAYQARRAEDDARREAKARETAERAKREAEAREAATPRRGRKVRVVRGRKVPIGTEGVVGWYGETRYGWRVGIDQSGKERIWTAANNVEVIP